MANTRCSAATSKLPSKNLGHITRRIGNSEGGRAGNVNFCADFGEQTFLDVAFRLQDHVVMV